MSTKSKITLLLVLTSLVGALVFGLLSYLDSRESLREAASEELKAIRTARAQQVVAFYDSVFDEASVVTENPTVREAMVEFRDAFDEMEIRSNQDLPIADIPYTELLADYYEDNLLPSLRPFIDRGEIDAETFMPRTEAGRYLQYRYMAEFGTPYDQSDEITVSNGDTRYERVHARFHEAMRFIRDEFDYHDIFLIDALSGDIIYTVDKESDFGTNIYTGPYRASGLGELVEEVKNDPTRRAVHFADLQFYLPSLGRPSVFVGSSIYDGSDVIGILALQIDNDDIDSILTADEKWEEVGLKMSGETYMVGPDGTLRNESRFFLEDREGYLEAIEGTSTPPDAIAKIKDRDTSVLLQNVDTEATRAAFRGETGIQLIDDYRGEQVLSSYMPVRIDGDPFAFVAEIDASEAFGPVDDLTVRMLITTAIVLPLTALLGIWLSGSLMRPTREMGATADAFVAGDDDVRFQDRGSDEWGQLGGRLNRVLDVARERGTVAESARGETSDMITRLMPYAIGERYADGERDIVSATDSASAATILLEASSANTPMTDLANPARARDLYERLDDIVDEIATKEGVDTLNQAGMHYLAFSGLTAELANHPERLFRFLEAFRDRLGVFNAEHGTHIRARVGFATGPMFGALVGNYSAAYEVWGGAVTAATDLAHVAKAGELILSPDSAELVGREGLGTSKTIRTPSGATVEGVHVPGFIAMKASG